MIVILPTEVIDKTKEGEKLKEENAINSNVVIM